MISPSIANAPKDPTHLHGVRILVVEDDEETREMIVEFLSLRGAVVFEAGTGQDGFEEFERERPDIILSDLWMTGGDGYEMIHRVRALPPNLGGLTPAVAMSAAENIRPALIAGFHTFAAKPFEIEALVEILADFTRSDTTPAAASWTIGVRRPGDLVLTFVGYVHATDVSRLVAALVPHLERGPCDVVVDLRRQTGFSPAVASVAERSVWDLRHNVRFVRVVGGSFVARLMATATCAMLGVPCALSDSVDS